MTDTLMKNLPSNLSPLPGIFTSLVLAHSMACGQTVLFSEDFEGDGSDLNETTPDVTTDDANWVAAPIFTADGTTGNSAGSATLAFTPVDGLIYTLDASISDLGLVAGEDNDWFALGFVNGQSTVNGIAQRFITGEVSGTAWIMHRGDISLGTNQTFLGTGQLGGGNFGLGAGGGDNTAQPWELTPPSAEIDLRVVLDTTGGQDNWKATWLAKVSGDATFLEVRPTENLLPGATISAVGLARSNDGISGTIERFSLTSSATASSPLGVRITRQEGSPLIEVEASESQQVDLYRSTTLESGTWGEPLATGLQNGDTFTDADAPTGQAFYIGVSSGDPAP
jgi:hypothetical protein